MIETPVDHGLDHIRAKQACLFKLIMCVKSPVQFQVIIVSTF